MIKSRALALGIVSAFVVIGGICMGVLLHFMMETAIEEQGNYLTAKYNIDDDGFATSIRQANSHKWAVWACGLVYIIPGLIGIIAAFVQNKCLYVTTSIFAIISLLLMGIIVAAFTLIIMVLIINVGAVDEYCTDTYEGCRCVADNDQKLIETHFQSCAGFSKFVALTISVMVFCVITWFVMLAEIVVACYYACCAKTTQSTGTILVPAQQPMLAPGDQEKPPHYYAQ